MHVEPGKGGLSPFRTPWAVWAWSWGVSLLSAQQDAAFRVGFEHGVDAAHPGGLQQLVPAADAAHGVNAATRGTRSTRR